MKVLGKEKRLESEPTKAQNQALKTNIYTNKIPLNKGKVKTWNDIPLTKLGRFSTMLS